MNSRLGPDVGVGAAAPAGSAGDGGSGDETTGVAGRGGVAARGGVAVGGGLARGATNGSGVAGCDRSQPLKIVDATPRPASRKKRRRVSGMIGAG